MSEVPIMPLDVGPLIGDTMHLSAEEFGAYMLLLTAMWSGKGRLPNDDKKLARICRMTPAKWKRIKPELIHFFNENDEFLEQKGLKKRWENVKRIKEVNSQNGKRGGRPKLLKDNDTGKATGYKPLKQNESECKPNGKAKKKHNKIIKYNPPIIPPENEEPKKRSRLPSDFEIPPDWIELAEAYEREKTGSLKINWPVEAESFVAHHQGKGSLMANWRAAWKTWYVNGVKKGWGAKRPAQKVGRMQMLREEREVKVGS